ncbi:hypothetical protein BJX70DRAFT_394524 [Aspergillus crustosus]
MSKVATPQLLDRTCSYETTESSSGPSAGAVLLSEFSDGRTLQPIYEIIHAQYSATISDETTAAQIAANYFRTVHLWFPILDPTHHSEQLSHPWNLQWPGFLVLSMCMVLVNALPVDGDLSGETIALYTALKASIGLIDSTGELTLEMIQARLLIAVFETGNGLHQAAYLTMGTTVRAALAAGLDNEQLDPESEKRPDSKQKRRVWSGLLILDRYVVLQMGKPGSQIHASTPRAGLTSLAGDVQEKSMLASNSGFITLEHASEMLGGVLAQVVDANSERKLNSTENLHLLSNLKSLKALCNGRAASEDASYCAAAAIALLLLIKSWIKAEGSNFGEHPTESHSALAAAVEDIVSETRVFEQEFPHPNSEAVPIFIIHPIYQAATLFRDLLRHTHHLDATTTMDILNRKLERLGQRWLAAGRYSEQLTGGTRGG